MNINQKLVEQLSKLLSVDLSEATSLVLTLDVKLPPTLTITKYINLKVSNEQITQTFSISEVEV